MSPQEIHLLDEYAGLGSAAEVMSGGDLDSLPTIHVRAQILSQTHNIKHGHAYHAELSFLLPEIDLLAVLMRKGRYLDTAMQFVPFSALNNYCFEEGVMEVERGLQIAQSFHWLAPELATENFAGYNSWPTNNRLFIGSEKPAGYNYPQSARVHDVSSGASRLRVVRPPEQS